MQIKQLVVAVVCLWSRFLWLMTDRLNSDRGRTLQAHGFFIGAVEHSTALLYLEMSASPANGGRTRSDDADSKIS